MSDAPRPKLASPVTAKDHAHGPADAPVTLVEYGDYQCPDCGVAHKIVKDVQRRMRSRLRFVFRNFPLTHSHAHAQHAAEAAEIAASQGRFWEMHDMLFEHQGQLADPYLIANAKALGLDEAKFKKDLSGHTQADRVQRDVETGERSGVNGTPTFFINGAVYDDDGDVETLLATLEAAAKPRVRSRARR